MGCFERDKNGKQRAGVLIPHVWYELNESGNFVECERQLHEESEVKK